MLIPIGRPQEGLQEEVQEEEEQDLQFDGKFA
jgi:hypothetical protein